MLLKEISIILAIYGLGEFLVLLLGTAFPGSVVGMLILLALLHLKWLEVKHIRYVSSFLLSYMPFFFIPAGVSVMASYTLMEGFVWQIILITILSTLVVMVVTGTSVDWFIRRGEEK